jgi:NADH:ubiquinone oxidoreductase subunit 6 (subunit J)
MLNTTVIVHFAPEKVALSLVGLVLSPVISTAVYWIALKRIQESQDTKSKAHLFYRMVSGILLAQFIGHTYWYVAPFWFIALFVALGYVMLDVAESIGRLWNTNPHYLPSDLIIEDIGLDKKTNVSNNMVVASDLTSNDFAEETFDILDSVKDMTKRRWMLGVLFFCLIVISCADGFHLTVTPISAPLLASYYVHGACLSLAVFSAMIHAHIHTSRRRRTWWFLLTLLWSVIYFCSALFVIIGQPPQHLVADILNHPAFVALYGFAAGTLLKIQFYFHFMKSLTADKRDLKWGILVFVMSCAIAMATSIYL